MLSDLSIRIDATSQDEVGQTATSFNRMVGKFQSSSAEKLTRESQQMRLHLRGDIVSRTLGSVGLFSPGSRYLLR